MWLKRAKEGLEIGTGIGCLADPSRRSFCAKTEALSPRRMPVSVWLHVGAPDSRQAQTLSLCALAPLRLCVGSQLLPQFVTQSRQKLDAPNKNQTISNY